MNSIISMRGLSTGGFYELELKNPNKKFYSVGHRQFCSNMKKNIIGKSIICLGDVRTDGGNR